MMEELVKAQATALLNKISEAVPVRWDRLTDEGPRLSVYGWIDRKCPVCPKGIIITDCEVCEGTGRDRALRGDRPCALGRPRRGRSRRLQAGRARAP
jgi:hypothetical protein